MKSGEISELQKRRSENIIWTCADDYSFYPDFRAYNSDGSADIYWNVIFGSARRHYDYGKFEKLFSGLEKYDDAYIYETVFWNALEPVLYRKELGSRPALESMRPQPEKTDLVFSDGMSDDEIVETARAYFLDRYGVADDGKIHGKFRLPHFRRMPGESFIIVKDRHLYHEFGRYGEGVSMWDGDFSLSTKLTDNELRQFMETKFGKSIYPMNKVVELEKKLCSGNHKGTHLLYTDGEKEELKGVYSSFEALRRNREALQIEKNRRFYEDNILQNRALISKLSTSIGNSILMHMQPGPVKSPSGKLNAPLAWRAAVLGDDRIFTRIENQNSGDMCVDILLDASNSQNERVEMISSQAYIISEALSKCGVPCRMMSFCSMSGFTVLNFFSDYTGPRSNGRIFDFVANGCSRDGLALRAAGNLISEAPYEHKMLIILSDVKPLDVVRVRSGENGASISYDMDTALKDTALEVRRIRAEGVSVVCIFTGTDEDLPAAKMVYGRDFVRIRDFSLFADTVGKLIQDQIKSFS